METFAVSPEVQKVMSLLVSSIKVKQALDFLENDHEKRIADQIEITEIPAPPFQEEVRATDYTRRLEELGLEDVRIDREGNTIGYLKGTKGTPKLVVSAHLDTVFPEGYDARVKIDDKGIIHAPGISDDSGGLAALLSLIRGLKATGLKTVGDILFVGTVGEEGIGDLRGVKYLFSSIKDIDGFISVDGDDVGKITYKGLGSKRFEFTFKGPGGHSFGAFGEIPNPIHAMGRAISKISDIQVPLDPKTTFAVSIVDGGTSVNSIPESVTMQTDTRSECPSELEKAVSEVVNCAKMGVIEENQRWKIAWNSKDNISLDIKLIGDRPPGVSPPDSIHVQAAWAAGNAIGQEPGLKEAGSTDSNIAINLGVPAMSIGRGGKADKIHSLKEWFDPTDAYLCPQHVLLTTLALAGLDGETEPLLVKHPGYEYYS